MKDIKVLVIDDEKNILKSVKMVLSYENYPVITANNGFEGINLFKEIKPEIVLLDVKMPGFTGIQVLKQMKEINQLSEIIMISGHSGIKEAVEASKLGAFDFLEKPISREKLILTIRNASEKVKLLKENYTLKNITEKKYKLVGESKAILKLKQTIKKVSKTNSTILIIGESGTGKELIARSIYNQSTRNKNKFIQVNCAAIPEELIESELFGHEKGSFTGAYEKKIGKFESAHQGSIFLDEIGDLSLKAQAKVLRVLEEGEIQRVGSSQIKKVDVRIIAATNKDLNQEIKNGNFREDLFFRLNVVPIFSPSLRERKNDIPILIEHFVNYFSDENNYKKKIFSKEVIKCFEKYNWKGNVRELRNLIEKLLIMTDLDIITENDLPDYMKNIQGKPSFYPQDIDLWKEFKYKSEKYFLENKLKEFKYNIAQTSKEIQLPRSNLYKKVDVLGIMFPDDLKADEGSRHFRNGEESPDSTGKGGS